MPPRRLRFVDTASRVPAWQALHAVADTQYPALARLWTAVFAELKDMVTQDALRDALTRGDLAAVQAFLARAWPEVGIGMARAPLLALLRETVTKAAVAVTPQLRETLDVSVRVRFNVISQEALTWIARYAGTQIREIGQTSMEAIRDVLRQQFSGELSVTQVMDRLEQIVGLTARQARSLETLRGELVKADVAPGEVARQVEVAAQRALRLRVESISRTESLAVANNAQQLTWQAAEQQGFLDTDHFKRFWILTPDSRLCVICKQIPSLNAGGVGLQEPFQTPLGPVQVPPVHVQCRCACSLREVR